VNNYLQWKRVIEIYVAGREKTSYLLADPSSPVTDTCNTGQQHPTTLDNDHDRTQDLGLGSSLHDCEIVMEFSVRSLQRKHQHQQGS